MRKAALASVAVIGANMDNIELSLAASQLDTATKSYWPLLSPYETIVAWVDAHHVRLSSEQCLLESSRKPNPATRTTTRH
jgi:hypothetical protein